MPKLGDAISMRLPGEDEWTLGRVIGNCGLLQILLCKTKFGQRSFRYRAVSIWNDLHSDLKKLTSLSKFKGDLKTDFFTNFILLFNI